MTNSFKQTEAIPLRKISDFKSKLTGGGARPNLFEVHLAFPQAAGVPDVLDEGMFLVKAAALPSSTVAPIEIPFRGRILKIAGDRTFETWTITVLNDTDFVIRSAFEKWMNFINKLDDGTGAQTPADYQATPTIHQLDRDGGKLRSYKFYDVWPSNISAIDMNYETTDTLEEFTVEMQVHYWEAIKGTSDSAGGEDIA